MTSEHSGLVLRSHYWDDRRAKDAFKAFLLDIHNLDLTLWDEAGFWDDHYTAFSLFDGERVVSSVCLYSMDMVIDGLRRRVGQFSGVGTLPSFRRRGLNRWLTERVLEWATPTHDGFFLFADEEAVPFYERCGFVPVRETIATLATDVPQPRGALVKLDPERDRDLQRVYALACARTPVSDALGVLTPKLLMFHFLYTLRDHAYYVEDLDVVAFFKLSDGKLILYDVLGRHVPSFSELQPYLGLRPYREVWFLFMPDRMLIEPTGRTTPADNNTHIHPTLRLPVRDVLFPYVAHA